MFLIKHLQETQARPRNLEHKALGWRSLPCNFLLAVPYFYHVLFGPLPFIPLSQFLLFFISFLPSALYTCIFLWGVLFYFLLLVRSFILPFSYVYWNEVNNLYMTFIKHLNNTHAHKLISKSHPCAQLSPTVCKKQII